jgi:hypothetical protein
MAVVRGPRAACAVLRLQIQTLQSQHDSWRCGRRDPQCGTAVFERFARMKAYTRYLRGHRSHRPRGQTSPCARANICSVFEGWSYEEIVPPIFDYYDVLHQRDGTGLEEQIYPIHRSRRQYPRACARSSLAGRETVVRVSVSASAGSLFTIPAMSLRFEKPKGGRHGIRANRD